jgi:hypothetical protein
VAETEVEEPEAELVEAEPVVEEMTAEAEVEAEAVEEAPEAVEEPEEEEEVVPAIDDLSRPLVEIKEEPEPETEKKKPSIVIARPGRDEAVDQEQEKSSRRKGKKLVFDEDMGEVVVKRKRKRGRGRPEWEDFDDFDLEDF